MNYFGLTQYISNSNLTEFEKALRGEEISPNLQQIFNMGNLTDAMVTEKHRVDFETNTLKGGAYENDIPFEQDAFLKAEMMGKAFWADPLVRQMCTGMKFQYVYAREQFPIEYEGDNILIKARCKFDGIHRGRMGLELKTTAATSQSAFMACLPHFNWDRAGAWYMDLARIDRHLFVGISKKTKHGNKPEIYKYAMQRGDEHYTRGKMKYQRLAYKYFQLIHSFNIA